MPITVVNPVGTPVQLGAGVAFRAQSDFVGPLQVGSRWLFALSDTTGDLEFTIANAQYTSQLNPFVSTIAVDSQWGEVLSHMSIPDGHMIKLTSVLEGPNNVILDQDSVQLPWSTTRGVGPQIIDIGTPTDIGLPPEQAQQLQDVHDSTFLNRLVDTLTLQELTSGPSGDFVSAQLTTPIFGVIVRLASVPEDLLPSTPDGDYWGTTLAVVRIFRGSDLWLRVPIHTSSKIVYLQGEGIVAVLSTLVANTWLLGMSVQVTFLAGVTGQVFLMRFPLTTSAPDTLGPESASSRGYACDRDVTLAIATPGIDAVLGRTELELGNGAAWQPVTRGEGFAAELANVWHGPAIASVTISL